MSVSVLESEKPNSKRVNIGFEKCQNLFQKYQYWVQKLQNASQKVSISNPKMQFPNLILALFELYKGHFWTLERVLLTCFRMGLD